MTNAYQNATKAPLSYRLSPSDELKLREVAYRPASKTNKSDIVRDWLEEYVKNPIELSRQKELLTHNSILVSSEVRDSLTQIAKQQGISVMELVRRIVEHNLQNQPTKS